MGPQHVNNVVDEAIRTALTFRGVAHITIPKDIQEWPFSDSKVSMANIPGHSGDDFAPIHPLPPQEMIQKAADLINAGKKLAILAGRGCLHAHDEVTQLAEAVGGPIVKPLLGKGVVPDRSPIYHGRHRPAGHGALAGGHGGMRHPDHDRDQLPLHRVPTQAGAGHVRANRRQRVAHRPALAGGGRPGRRR
jgi:thiamine pyrophosphate-dependent acetolactate synthase large subunit-like protein